MALSKTVKAACEPTAVDKSTPPEELKIEAVNPAACPVAVAPVVPPITIPLSLFEDKVILAEYKKLIEKLPNVYFGGRLGSYQYLDMHMAINQAHITFKDLMRSRWN
jgi:hypothetical protein